MSDQIIFDVDGLIIRTEYPQIPPKVEYSLSEMGEKFRCVLDISSFVIRFLALLFISDTKIH